MGDETALERGLAAMARYSELEKRDRRARELAPELVEALRELWRYGVNSEAVSIEEYHCALDRAGTLLARIDGETA